MSLEMQFMKNGREIKEAIGWRVDQLQSRLGRRNQVLDEFMKDGRKLRSYLIRMSEMDFSHGRMGTPSALYGLDDISSEEKQEIHQLCQRIFDLEQEIRRLELIRTHLDEKQEVSLSYNELVSYGFSDN